LHPVCDAVRAHHYEQCEKLLFHIRLNCNEWVSASALAQMLARTLRLKHRVRVFLLWVTVNSISENGLETV
jgi:hypothetical protein